MYYRCIGLLHMHGMTYFRYVRFVRMSSVQPDGGLFCTAAVWAEMKKSVPYKVLLSSVEHSVGKWPWYTDSLIYNLGITNACKLNKYFWGFSCMYYAAWDVSGWCITGQQPGGKRGSVWVCCRAGSVRDVQTCSLCAIWNTSFSAGWRNQDRANMYSGIRFNLSGCIASKEDLDS